MGLEGANFRSGMQLTGPVSLEAPLGLKIQRGGNEGGWGLKSGKEKTERDS